MSQTPFYDPNLSYEDNFAKGPFGDFRDEEQVSRTAQPQTDFLGHKVYLPFGIPAGPLLNANFVSAAFRKGFDLCVYKTVRSRTYASHPWPNVLGVQVAGDLTLARAKQDLIAANVYRDPLSITNSFGVPSMSPDFWQEDMRQAVAAAGEGQLLIGSFQGTKSESGKAEDLIADFVLTACLVKETGAKILEANLSCPNEGTAELLCFDTQRVRLIVEGIKNEIGNTPLILKLGYFKDQQHLADYIRQIGPLVEGLSSINTIPAPIVTKTGEQALPGQGRLMSGVCGAAIKWAGVEMVQRLAALREQYQQKFAIIGVGGVTQAADFHEYRTAGADAVMSATGAMWRPELALEILKQNK